MATNKKQQLEFTAKNVKAFATWLKRFSMIDKSLLLEIDQSKSSFVGKSYNEERSVVKMSSIKFTEAGLTSKPTKDSKRIKVGIYNIPILIKIMDQFNEDEFSLVIEYQELINENETQYAGEKILLKNNNLKMNVDCTSLNIFKYISDELFTSSIAAIDTIASFELTKTAIEKINTLNSLDNDYNRMDFSIKDKKTLVSGNSYEYVIQENKTEVSASLSIFKDQYVSLDVENYKVDLGEDRLVFNSDDSNTVTVISMASEKE